MSKIICIYKITNPDGKVYIGATTDYTQRINAYRITKCKNQIKIFNSLKKWGFENHFFEIVEMCSKEQLRELEAKYGRQFNVLDEYIGLNDNIPKVNKLYSGVSDSVRKKQSENKVGLYLKDKNPFYNKTHSEETKKTISDFNKGHKHWVGKSHSIETKQKIKAVRAGKFKGSDNYNFGNRGESNTISKIILNTQTGIFYFGIKEAAFAINMNESVLRKRLSGARKNITDFIIV